MRAVKKTSIHCCEAIAVALRLACIFTARKRSLEQDNVFTPVCQFTDWGRGLPMGGFFLRGSASGGVCLQGWGGERGICLNGGSASRWGLPPGVEVGSASRGEGSASRGFCIQGGLGRPPTEIRTADGTHSTRMLSCSKYKLAFRFSIRICSGLNCRCRCNRVKNIN